MNCLNDLCCCSSGNNDDISSTTNKKSNTIFPFDWEQNTVNLQDYNTLKDGVFLNDTVIGFAYDYFQNVEFKQLQSDANETKRILYIHPVTVNTMKMMGQMSPDFVEDTLNDLEFVKYDFVFLPINDGTSTSHVSGGHWSLLIFEKKSLKFFSFDSGNQGNYPIALRVVKILSKSIVKLYNKSNLSDIDSSNMNNDEEKSNIVTKKIKIGSEAKQTPLQMNGHDCGMYVIQISKYLSQKIFNDSNNNLSLQEFEFDKKQLNSIGKNDKIDKNQDVSLNNPFAPNSITAARKEWQKIIVDMGTKVRQAKQTN